MSNSDFIPLTDVGYPPMSPNNIVGPVHPGRWNRNFVIGFINLPIFKDKLDLTMKLEITINGNKDGIKISEQKNNPFFTPFELYSGNISIIAHISIVKDNKIIVWMDFKILITL